MANQGSRNLVDLDKQNAGVRGSGGFAELLQFVGLAGIAA